jgi:tRNA threonylcarbamoyladenosine biosynthesis protein TsaB
VTVGKILAYTTNKPICGVPTLEALAYNARNARLLICPIINAGRDTVYAAFYRPKSGTITKVSEYYVGDIRKLFEMIKEPAVFIGSGARSYSKLINQTLGSQSIDVKTIEDAQVGAAVALLAASRLEHGNSDDALSLQPLYLKESTARAFVNRYSIGVRANSHGQLPTNEL